MTLEHFAGSDRKFVPAILPWVIAAAALAVYVATLCHWVTLGSLWQTARISGWTAQPEMFNPVSWLVTLPFRWLPARVIPLALNLFNAVCAGLTLGLLARSVALLPHDRTHEQRQRQRTPSAELMIRSAWLPPVFAVIVCGLQLTFWEHATSATSLPPPWGSGAELFDLLIFAYIIRCLLEFRHDQRESWLARASLCCGLGITNNWALIGFSPLFIVALVWLKGLGFFNVRFLVRMFLWGLAGLMFYLVLPLAQPAISGPSVPFWTALKNNLAGEQYAVSTVFGLLKTYKQETLLMALTSLVPLLLISIRWASYFGDTSRLGIFLTTTIFHLVHALFLIVCIWTALDPPFSARNKGFGFPSLTLSYLAALCVGYFAGYFLLLFSGTLDGSKRSAPGQRIVDLTVTGAVWLLLILSPLVLVYRNLGQIRVTNGPMLRQFASALGSHLPHRAVVLSDDVRRLLLLKSASVQDGTAPNYMFVDTSQLPSPEYQRLLNKEYPTQWTNAPPRERRMPFESGELMNTISDLASSNAVYYLHPSFGYYFEMFYAEPHGLAYKLVFYPDGTLLPPPLTNTVVAENAAFWSKADKELLLPVLDAMRAPEHQEKPGLIELLLQKLYLNWRPNRQASLLGTIYSRALDYWGVELQGQSQWKSAATWFQRALELNPDNVVAKINFECNQNVQAGRRIGIQSSKPITDLFGDRYRNWDQVMGDNGPFFEPTFCYAQGLEYIRNGLYRQAGAQMERVMALTPGSVDARLWMANLYVLGRQPEPALKLLKEIHDQPELLPINRTNVAGVLSIETTAHLAANDLAGAEAAVQTATAKYPGDLQILWTAAQAYTAARRHTNAIVLLDQILKAAPDDPATLMQKGYAYMQLESFDKAIDVLSHVLKVQTNNYPALFNRAISCLRSDKLEAAQRDYAMLQKVFPSDYRLYFGLGEIAYRQQDTNSAVRNYELYLANNSRTNTAEAKLVSARLKELKPPGSIPGGP